MTTSLLSRCGLVLLSALGLALHSPLRAHDGSKHGSEVGQSPTVGAALDPNVRRKFSLVDHNGRSVTEKSFAGDPLLIFFGFVGCPDVCPTGLADIGEVVTALEGKKIKVTPLFITVDPERDTPQVLAAYVKSFHPRTVALTGTQQAVANAAAAYGVKYGVTKTSATYYVWHSANIFLVSGDGRVLKTFPPQASATSMTNDASRLLGKR